MSETPTSPVALHPRPVAARHLLGSPGSTCSPRPATRRPRRAGPATRDTVEEARANPESIADHGIDDVVEHYADDHRPACRRQADPRSATPSAA